MHHFHPSLFSFALRTRCPLLMVCYCVFFSHQGRGLEKDQAQICCGFPVVPFLSLNIYLKNFGSFTHFNFLMNYRLFFLVSRKRHIIEFFPSRIICFPSNPGVFLYASLYKEQKYRPLPELSWYFVENQLTINMILYLS